MDGTLTGKRRDGGFLEKLWNFLDDSSIRDVMYFSPNGEYLIIEDPDAVPALLRAANICNHKDYASFQRVMTIYGWKRLTQTEMESAILVNGEEPGTLCGRLASQSKLMRHATLDRDSSIDEVKAVTRNAKPKASRAKHAGISAALNAVSSAAALARKIGEMSTLSSQSTFCDNEASPRAFSAGEESNETSAPKYEQNIPSEQDEDNYQSCESQHLAKSPASFEAAIYPHTTRLQGASFSSFAYGDLQKSDGPDSSIATTSHFRDQQDPTFVKGVSTASASSHWPVEAIYSKGEKPAIDRYAKTPRIEPGQNAVLQSVSYSTPDESNDRSSDYLPSRLPNLRPASSISYQPVSTARTELSHVDAEVVRSGFSGCNAANIQYAPLRGRQQQTGLPGYAQHRSVHQPRHHL